MDAKLPRQHWDDVYQRKPADSLSWYRTHLDTSMALLRDAGLTPTSRIIDVGGGASTLVDDLMAAGVADITVLDLSAHALAVARERLGGRAAQVRWLADDVLDVQLPPASFDLWHDRAVLHFLTDPVAAGRYAEQAAAAIRTCGFAVIGGFAPDGPERCSGLLVARRSAEEVAQLMGERFRLVHQRAETHVTPGGTTQAFCWTMLERRADR